MSNALALGAVTAVLKNLLDNAVVDEVLTGAVGPVKVTAISPDQIKLAFEDKFVGLNLFLYHVQPNPGWSNVGYPSRDSAGTRINNPPLALDLFYLVSAYTKADFDAEILLGYAMQLFHEMPVISRQVIRSTFVTNPVVDGDLLPVKFQSLAAADLADQVEQLKIAPYSMSSEESSKLWSAMQTNFRPSVAYHVSVVLIESKAPKKSPPPVLKVGTSGPVAQANVLPPFPTILGVTAPNKQPSVKLGQTLTVAGHHLSGVSVMAKLSHPLATSLPPVGPLVATDNEALVPIPNLPNTWPAGNYVLTLVVDGTKSSNALPVAVAPVIDIAASTAVRPPASDLTVTIQCSPQVKKEQAATLVVGGVEVMSNPLAADTSTLTFVFPKAIAPPPGDYHLRLRIDGVESQFIDRTGDVPKFDDSQKKAIP